MFQYTLHLLPLIGYLCIDLSQSTSLDQCYVTESERKDCGYPGINADNCKAKECCWNAVTDTADVPWCFHPSRQDTGTDIKTLKHSLIDKFTSGLDLILGGNSQQGNTVGGREDVPPWMQNIMDEISNLTPGNSISNLVNKPAQPNKIWEDEKICKRANDMFLNTAKGKFECTSVSRYQRVNCVSGKLPRGGTESECTACTKRNCCYDPTVLGSGVPHCFKTKYATAPAKQPKPKPPTTVQGFSNKPKWMDLLSQMGVPSSSLGSAGREQNSWGPTNGQMPSQSLFNSNNGQGSSAGRPAFNPFNQLNRPGIGSSNPGSILNALNPAQGNGLSSNNLFESLLGGSGGASSGLFGNSPSTPSGSQSSLAELLNLPRPSQPTPSSNFNIGNLLGSQGTSPGSSPGNMAELLNYLKRPTTSTGNIGNFLSSLNTQQRPTTGNLNNNNNIPQGTGSSNKMSQLLNLLKQPGASQTPSPGDIGNFLSSMNSQRRPSTGYNLLETLGPENMFGPMFGRPNPATGFGANMPGVPGLGSLLTDNSALTPNGVTGSSNRPNAGSNSLFSSLFPGLPKPSSLNSNKPKPSPTTAPEKEETQENSDEKNSAGSASKSAYKSPFLAPFYEKENGKLPEKLCYPKNCGTRGGIHSERAMKRIVGGTAAGGIGEWPWVCSLRRNFPDALETYKHVCGAVVIDEKWILTAGHCLTYYTSKSRKVVGKAETNLKPFVLLCGTYSRDEVEETTQIRVLAKFIPHPEYDFKSLKYDIAVAELKEPLEITDAVRPVCLPSKISTLEVGARTWVTGWGDTLRVGDHDGTTLKELPLPIISLEECKKHWDRHGYRDWICTKGAYLEDACTGDSGGPLVYRNDYGRYEVVGIAIAGTKECSTDRFDIRPGIYTKVAYYREFIDITTNGAC